MLRRAWAAIERFDRRPLPRRLRFLERLESEPIGQEQAARMQRRFALLSIAMVLVGIALRAWVLIAVQVVTLAFVLTPAYRRLLARGPRRKR